MAPTNQRKPLFRPRRRFVPFYWVLLGFIIGAILGLVSPAFAYQYLTPADTAHGELGYLGFALESYRIDHGVYPPGNLYAGELDVSLGLTTPTVYVSTMPGEPAYGLPEARRNIVEYYSVIIPFSLLILAGLWVGCFIRFPTSRHAIFWEGALLWVAGLSVIYVVPPVMTMRWFFPLYQHFWPLAGGSLFAILWWRLASRVRKITGREIMVAIIMPMLLVFCLLMEVTFHVILEWKRDALGPWPQYYQYATDGKSWWLMQSTGPDRDYDLDLEALLEDSRAGELSLPLSPRVEPMRYDPSNGTATSGDVLRWGPWREGNP